MTQPEQPNDTGAQQPAEAQQSTAEQLKQKAGAVLAAVTPQAASAAAAAQNRFGKVFARLQQSALLGKVLRPVEAFADWIVGIARIRWMLAAAYPAQTRSAEFKLFLLFFGTLALCASLLFIGIPVCVGSDVVVIVILLVLSLPLLVSGMRAILNRNVPRYMSFSGRAGRMEFFIAALFFVVIAFTLSSVFGYVARKILIKVLHHRYEFEAVGNVISIVLLLPVFAACSRRLQDTGRSGWIQLPLHVATFVAPDVVTRVRGKFDFLGAMESCGGINLDPNCGFGILEAARQEMWTVYITILFCIAVSIFLFYGRKGQNGRNRFGEVVPRLRDIKPFQEQAPEQHAAEADDGIAQSAAATPTSAVDAVVDTPPRRE